MNKADRMVNINAWINATKNSIKPINTAKKIEAGAIQSELKIKIKHNKDITKMCPAVMFANNLTAKAIGLVKIPKISTGIISGFNHQGTGGFKMCAQ